jgi:prepilin-type N-terminal cleavage/methylation domain-containing protein
MTPRPAAPDDERGFSLLETIIAMAILAGGLLTLAGVFTLGMAHLASSSANLTAREKAREAIESVHSARDVRTIRWQDIRNQSQGGVFLDGEQPLRTAGPDGLVNTADDGAIETSLSAGPDNILGTADDVATPLSTYTRKIVISDIIENGQPNATLRELTVTIGFKVGQLSLPPYVLRTFISAVS